MSSSATVSCEAERPPRAARRIAALLFTLLSIRAVAAAIVPIGDTIEARYAQVARLMLASRDWVTPQLDPGAPFWAKPTLSL